MISYRIASAPEDYSAAYALIKEEGVQSESLSFPTLLASDQDRIVGVLGTYIQSGMVIAGPLVIRSDKRRVLTAIRLIELYEIAMRGMGVTAYVFHTEEGTTFDKVMQRYSAVKPYAVEGQRKFFVRRIENGRQN